MTNSHVAYGLKPVKDSTAMGIKTGRYFVPASLASLGIGTPVTLGGTANSSRVTTKRTDNIGSLPSIAVATGGSGNALLGVIVGFESDPQDPYGNTTESDYNPASTARIAFVAHDPFQKFTIVDDGANVIGIAAVGLNANLTVGTVDATTHIDSTTLDTSTPATTAAFQLKILRATPEGQLSNDATLAGAEWEVMINNHALMPGVVGIS